MTIFWLYSLSFLVFSASLCVASIDAHKDLLQCLTGNNQHSIYTPNNTSDSSILQFSIQNQRFNTAQTHKPHVVVIPLSEHEAQQVILCAKETNMHVKVRNGGHDYEGLSFVSNEVPFVLVDLINLRNITVNVEDKSVWVDAGSSIGELSYRIAEKSKTLGFPVGSYPTAGVSGYFSGGGTGFCKENMI